jgi:predicted choloylglycine hydrolase
MMRSLIFTFFSTFFILHSPDCLILFLKNGNEVLVANHEDWYARDAEVTFVPASKGKLGMLYFDFASEGTAQGGMNTEGLFFDGTATPRAAYPSNTTKPDCNCYIWKSLLQECATVEQAISFIQRYRIPEIERIHILVADKAGNSAIVGVYNGQMRIHRNRLNHQLLTNFNISDPAYGGEPKCSRFAKAEMMLSEDSAATVHNLRNILAQTTQGQLTVYSNIYNLTNGEVVVYSQGNFSNATTINLSAELRKGRHSISIDKLVRANK